MPTTDSGIFYDVRGPATGKPVLLIEGHTGQLIGWRDEFCDLLVHAGMRVIRMDNRDVGLSRHEDNLPGGYTIADMAHDVADVLDDLKMEQATIVGQSMGGMIAQHLALDYPHRVAGLVLFYTTPTLEDVSLDALRPGPPPPHGRAAAIEAFLAADRATTSPAYGYDEAWKRELADRMFDRDPTRSGLARQREAIQRIPDLRLRLSELTMPIALIHGRDDSMVAPQGSLRIAEIVEHAELHLYPGMGHEIAPALWLEFVNIINRTATRH